VVIRWVQFLLGLLGIGAAGALMIRSQLGLGPWDCFHMGIFRLTGISVGRASILTGAVVVAGSFLVRVRPEVGTLVNMVVLGLMLDFVLHHLPVAASWEWGLAYYLLGLAIAGVSTGLYIAAGLGKGPRDGLMVGLAERSGWPVRRVRTCIEATVLLLGWLLGGPIGVGTIIYAVCIGPSVQWGMQLFGVIPPAGPRAAMRVEPVLVPPRRWRWRRAA
jgi:uncharacterized membrane protein YczE